MVFDPTLPSYSLVINGECIDILTPERLCPSSATYLYNQSGDMKYRILHLKLLLQQIRCRKIHHTTPAHCLIHQSGDKYHKSHSRVYRSNQPDDMKHNTRSTWPICRPIGGHKRPYFALGFYLFSKSGGMKCPCRERSRAEITCSPPYRYTKIICQV